MLNLYVGTLWYLFRVCWFVYLFVIPCFSCVFDCFVVVVVVSALSRIRMDENGNLIFAKLMSSDEGRYQCSAQNVVATRETAAVLLSVHGRFRDAKYFLVPPPGMTHEPPNTPNPPTSAFDMIHPNILSIPLLIFYTYISTYYVEEPNSYCLLHVSHPPRIKGKKQWGAGDFQRSRGGVSVVEKKDKEKYWMMWDESNWISHISIIIIAALSLYLSVCVHTSIAGGDIYIYIYLRLNASERIDAHKSPRQFISFELERDPPGWRNGMILNLSYIGPLYVFTPPIIEKKKMFWPSHRNWTLPSRPIVRWISPSFNSCVCVLLYRIISLVEFIIF